MRRLAALGILLAGLGACDLTLTLDPEPLDALQAPERAAADRVFARLQAYDARLRSVSAGAHALGPIAADESRLSIAPDGLWVMYNFGDDRIHFSAWENLSDDQHQRFASWFGESLTAAAARYGTFFYEFVALHLAGVQTVYAVQEVAWVYGHRHMFNIDRDAERLVDTYLAESDNGLLAFAWATCTTIVARFDAQYGAWFGMEDYGAHVHELTDVEDPTGQIYMICRHLQAAEARRTYYGSSFAAEIEVLEEYRAGETVPGSAL